MAKWGDGTMALIRIPRKFFDDHGERELPCPNEVKETSRHVWIDTDDPAFDSLVSDAEYYADKDGPDDCPPGIRRAAISLLKSVAAKIKGR